MQTQMSPRASMQSDEKKPTPLPEESLRTIVESVSLLARHFRRELDEFEMQTYVTALRDQTPEQVSLACQRALLTLKRMPLIADLRELANPKTDNVISLPYWKREPESYAPKDYQV